MNRNDALAAVAVEMRKQAETLSAFCPDSSGSPLGKQIDAWADRIEQALATQQGEAVAVEGVQVDDAVSMARDALKACDWSPADLKRGFNVEDEAGEHDPCHVWMPDGSGLDFNHHAVNGVDQARAEFVATACNHMLAALALAHKATVQVDDANELARLRELINLPELHDFAKGVVLEAGHQRERWGSNHDAGKEASDWFWLVGYLAGKALNAHTKGDYRKALHHTISTAAALANWHGAIEGTTNMRPGIDGEAALAHKPTVQVDDAKYAELIYAVGNKYPGESRHETALRYIRQAEQSSGEAQTALAHKAGE